MSLTVWKKFICSLFGFVEVPLGLNRASRYWKKSKITNLRMCSTVQLYCRSCDKCNFLMKPLLRQKRGNKNFYKGTQTGRMGHWTAKGNYIVESRQLRTFVVPREISFTPHVTPLVQETKRAHTWKDYFRPINWSLDPKIAITCRKFKI